ncbi:MAG: mannose-1-phosphate guanylyltransferase/mannose-6-phosphate isomerase, partial [Paracoccaceae bacterium]
MKTIYPVILCGGSGTRLWPSSRKAFPKQFSSLLGPESLYQKTLRRLSGELFGAVTVLTHADFRFLARQQAEEIGLTDARIVLEPASRNTAPAILTAALMRESSPDDLLLIAPSDHLMKDPDAFSQAIVAGIGAAESGQLVTFGVTPDRAETGFGYLELYDAAVPGNATQLRRFVEKPDSARATEMVASGRHLWNSGIFLFRVADILAAFEAHAAELIAPCRAALTDAGEDLGFLRLDPASYGKAASVSIDYAVMEKADNISVVPVNAGWSDVGSWKTLYSAQDQTEHGVATDGPVTALDCENTYLRSEEDNLQLLALGLKNMVAVATRDPVLLADIDRAQDVRIVFDCLRADGVAQADTYPRF